MATYQVKSASSIVGVSASSIRAWCATFAEFLSTTANPGPDQPRIDSQEKDRASRVTLLALGFVAGLLVAAILIGGAWLMK